MNLRHLLTSVAAVAAAAASSGDALAQGCVNARQSAPVIGSTGPYLEAGQLLFSQNFRYLNADTHFLGTKELSGLNATGSNGENEQRVLNIGFTYALSDRNSLALDIPWLLSGTWSLPLPMGPPMMPGPQGPRYKQHAEGLGDISLTARHWILDPVTHEDFNFAFGLGLKAPTGEDNAKSLFGQMNGNAIRQRSVDMSIQPGDGGWGGIVDAQSFYNTDWCSFFVYGSYLLNPEETNDTVSNMANLMGEQNVPAEIRFNSIPDRFLFRVGAAREIESVPGLVPSLAWRVEGVPARDLIGGEDGWRQPGYTTFIEPGVSYTHGSSTWSLSVPVSLVRNRIEDARGNAGDAIFADWVILLGWTFSL